MRQGIELRFQRAGQTNLAIIGARVCVDAKEPIKFFLGREIFDARVVDPQFEAVAIALDHRRYQRLLGGEVVMDGCIFHIQFFCDVGLAEAIEALLLQEGLGQIHDCALCI